MMNYATHDNEGVTYHNSMSDINRQDLESGLLDLWIYNDEAEWWELVDGTDTEANTVAVSEWIPDWYAAGGWDL